jgi:hypothetical protein
MAFYNGFCTEQRSKKTYIFYHITMLLEHTSLFTIAEDDDAVDDDMGGSQDMTDEEEEEDDDDMDSDED